MGRCSVSFGVSSGVPIIFEGYVNGYLLAQVSGLYLLTYPDIDKGASVVRFHQSLTDNSRL